MALQVLLFGRALRHGVLAPVLVTFGLSVMIENLLQVAATSDPRGLNGGVAGAGQLPHRQRHHRVLAVRDRVPHRVRGPVRPAAAALAHLVGPQGARDRRRPGHRPAGGHQGAAGVRDRGGHRGRHRGPGGRLHRHDRHLRPADRHEHPDLRVRGGRDRRHRVAVGHARRRRGSRASPRWSSARSTRRTRSSRSTCCSSPCSRSGRAGCSPAARWCARLRGRERPDEAEHGGRLPRRGALGDTGPGQPVEPDRVRLHRSLRRRGAWSWR